MSKKKSQDDALYKDYNWIYNQYVIEGKTALSIDIEFKFTEGTTFRWLRNHNIPRRTRKEQKRKPLSKEHIEHMKESWARRKEIIRNERIHPYQNKEWLENNYTNKRRIASDIANECNCSSHEILKWLRIFDIHIRNTNAEKFTGSHHPEESKLKRRGTGNVMSRPDVREKHAIACQDPLHKQKLSKSQKERWKNVPLDERCKSESTKQKLSDSLNRFYKEHPEGRRIGHPPNPGSGYGKGAYYNTTEGNVIWMNSTYEIRTATALTNSNIHWEYESKSFQIHENGSVYWPDFYIVDYDILFEVKGLWFETAKYKVKNFVSRYPNETLKIIYDEHIQELECYAHNKWNFDINNIGINVVDIIKEWDMNEN